MTLQRAPRRASTRTAPPYAPWGWAWLGAGIGLALILALAAPARWLAAGLAQATQGAVVLAEPQGNIWSGTARLVLTGGAGSRDSTALPGRVQWQLRPQLTGLMARLSADCCTPQTPIHIQISPRWNGAQVQVGDGQSFWPALLLTGLGTPWNTVRPQGELALLTRSLAVHWHAGRMDVTGQAEITARQMSSRLSTLEPLGSYRVVLNGGGTNSGQALSLKLTTLEGHLQLSADGQWIGTRLRLRGQAQAAPGMEAPLANLLNVLGRRQGERAIISLG
ncbi:type II secretion system protein N [Ottowia sp.]|uniref:type II secretion system protein N n=1 Tax=Ottowia sp. TaxID=1898956 RepID=UPI003A87853E